MNFLYSTKERQVSLNNSDVEIAFGRYLGVFLIIMDMKVQLWHMLVDYHEY